MSPERFRSRFPILEHKIHLANCSQAPLSVDVRAALERYQQSLIDQGMDWEVWMGEVRAARAEFAQLIGPYRKTLRGAQLRLRLHLGGCRLSPHPGAAPGSDHGRRVSHGGARLACRGGPRPGRSALCAGISGRLLPAGTG